MVGRTNASFALGQVVGTSAPFSGPIVFSSVLGTLTAQVAGSFDVASGAFHAASTSLAGSGLLRGIGGSVTLAGVEGLRHPDLHRDDHRPAVRRPEPGWVNGVVVASSTKPRRRRIGRLSGEASTCR